VETRRIRGDGAEGRDTHLASRAAGTACSEVHIVLPTLAGFIGGSFQLISCSVVDPLLIPSVITYSVFRLLRLAMIIITASPLFGFVFL
jgi:hypothetical protein